ncbi:MAG: TonB-dependent receptor, partial [Bacteroidetes bacterium]|nr:TonB-dependent receptor [Bacteroidota bacterium]
SIFLKTYGSGSLATASFRGTTSYHTQLEWNGININSPMLGQSDLSLIPLSLTDGIELYYGAASISQGSGGFGGIINVTGNPDWNNQLNAHLTQVVSSFENYSTILSVNAGNKRIQNHVKAFHTNGINNFPFSNDYSGKREYMKNNVLRQFGATEELFLKINEKHVLGGKFWYTQSERQLSPTTARSHLPTTEKQDDKSFRGLADWYYVISETWNLRIKTAYTQDVLHYMNDSIDDVHRTQAIRNKITIKRKTLSWMTGEAGIDVNYDWVVSDAYEGTKQRWLTGLYSQLNFLVSRPLKFNLLLRQDMVDQEMMPFLPAIGMEWTIFRKTNLVFHANVSRNYRKPTLNDLYWRTFGNPDLHPEESYSGEAGLAWDNKSNLSRFTIETDLTGYWNYISNLIMWTPTPESPSLFKPVNINEVNGRGVELNVASTLHFKKISFILSGNYNFTHSTYGKKKSENDQSAGKQLIYTPLHKTNGTLTLAYSGFRLSYHIDIFSKRYTSTDNKSLMPGYQVSNIMLGKSFRTKQMNFFAMFEICNIFDLDYQSISNRPMPGRSVAFSLKISYLKR